MNIYQHIFYMLNGCHGIRFFILISYGALYKLAAGDFSFSATISRHGISQASLALLMA